MTTTTKMTTKVKGWTGKRLRVDLTSGTTKIEEIDRSYRKRWLGGRGFNSELLYKEVGPDIDPLGPDNRLIFGVGPLTGTFAPASSRTTITAK
jgi:aldehyde:ferredoxin oxidoreductase